MLPKNGNQDSRQWLVLHANHVMHKSSLLLFENKIRYHYTRYKNQQRTPTSWEERCWMEQDIKNTIKTNIFKINFILKSGKSARKTYFYQTAKSNKTEKTIMAMSNVYVW